MWIRITLCVVLGGCGFRSQAAAGDAPGTSGPGSDAPGSDAGSGAATDCLQRWFDGAPGLAFSTPQEIIATPSNTDDRDPWVSADGLRLYFARNPGSHGKSDIYLTTRPSPADAFATLQAMDNLNTVDDEERPAPNSDETILIFSGNHMTGGAFQLFVSRRIATTDPFPSPSSPDQMLVATINAVPGGYFDPFLTRSGLKLYLALGPNGGPAQQIAVATRTSTDQNFPASVPVPVISSTSGDANPSVSADDRIIVFSSRRAPGVGWARQGEPLVCDPAEPGE